MSNHDPIRAALERWHGLLETDLLCPDNPAETDWGAVALVAAQTRAALATPPAGDGPAALPAGFIDPEHKGEALELLQTFYRACRSEGGTADEITLRGIKAVLAAASPSTTPAPVEGEVGKMVEWLHEEADDYNCIGADRLADNCTRAAALLQQQATELAALRAGVVPVVKRPWEQPGWCDAEGCCWFMEETRSGQLIDWMWIHTEPDLAKRPIYCLPHWAIPQPPRGGEVEG